MNKRPLSFDEYDKYDISHHAMAYELSCENITVERANTIENELLDRRHEIISIDLKVQAEGKYHLQIIALEPKSFTF